MKLPLLSKLLVVNNHYAEHYKFYVITRLFQTIDENLPLDEQKTLMAEPSYRLLTRLDREFTPQTEILVSNQGKNLQNLNQKLK